MITNFENITHGLTDKELRMVELIVRGLRNKIGKDRAITNPQMVKGLANLGHKTTAPRIRKMIHYIRLTGKVEYLVGTSKGYYITHDKNELRKYVESLEQRIASIDVTVKQMNYQISKL
jgi:hypothetical protein